MAFLVSPGVQVNEVDLTNVVPTVATSIMLSLTHLKKVLLVLYRQSLQKVDLVSKFGKPNSNNFEKKLLETH